MFNVSPLFCPSTTGETTTSASFKASPRVHWVPRVHPTPVNSHVPHISVFVRTLKCEPQPITSPAAHVQACFNKGKRRLRLMDVRFNHRLANPAIFRTRTGLDLLSGFLPHTRTAVISRLLCRDRSDANVTRFAGYCQSPARKPLCFHGVWMKIAPRRPAAVVEKGSLENRGFAGLASAPGQLLSQGSPLRSPGKPSAEERSLDLKQPHTRTTLHDPSRKPGQRQRWCTSDAQALSRSAAYTQWKPPPSPSPPPPAAPAAPAAAAASLNCDQYRGRHYCQQGGSGTV
ncbi:hypothetical protein Q8A73_002606 [Channa argus]|nr:hypothetical protein Q8A73_002606 [Channa argus]